ncbi:MAG TPA: DUF979 domain-containing protein [Caulobacteraceae bacterium]|jgi:uncharacterized membrane protein|nr:DUF979 domain-containing protein [Caulobacteraceae bacterium]
MSWPKTLDLHVAYYVCGALFALWAVLSVLDKDNRKRWSNGLFWALVAVSFIAGDAIGDVGNGVLVIALALIAGFIGLGVGKPATTTPQEREVRSRKHGDWLFAAALIVPAVTFVLSLSLMAPQLTHSPPLTLFGQPFLGKDLQTVVALAIGIVIALVISMLWLRPGPVTPFQEGRRLVDSIGWATILPQALASLGAVFVAGGVGKAVSDLTSSWIPQDNAFAVVAIYTCGMAMFTIVMGNAFAAFPIMTAAIGMPLIVGRLHGDPVIMAAIGMLSGYSGTLMTPMAANFNVVPAVLLNLPDKNAILNGVIRAQIPTGALMLVVNTALLYLLVFRF